MPLAKVQCNVYEDVYVYLSELEGGKESKLKPTHRMGAEVKGRPAMYE
jgi:hypothetical protein